MTNKVKIPNYVFTIYAYEEKEGAQFQEITTINVFAEDAKSALAKAKYLIDKKGYYIIAINEINQFTNEMLTLQKRSIKNMERLHGIQKRPWEKPEEDEEE